MTPKYNPARSKVPHRSRYVVGVCESQISANFSLQPDVFSYMYMPFLMPFLRKSHRVAPKDIEHYKVQGISYTCMIPYCHLHVVPNFQSVHYYDPFQDIYNILYFALSQHDLFFPFVISQFQYPTIVWTVASNIHKSLV